MRYSQRSEGSVPKTDNGNLPGLGMKLRSLTVKFFYSFFALLRKFVSGPVD
jgi:hypothetical protein